MKCQYRNHGVWGRGDRDATWIIVMTDRVCEHIAKVRYFCEPCKRSRLRTRLSRCYACGRNGSNDEMIEAVVAFTDESVSA